jgi:threonine/homoserine/homoserine lactone efflux protein
MNLELILSLAGMAFTASLTPGPNNSMLASSGATYGVRASMPHVLGIIIGFPVMIFLVGFGLGELFRQSPVLQQFMRIGGALMMLWIAWKIANAEPPGAVKSGTKPLTFLQSAAFQWINPKAGWRQLRSPLNLSPKTRHWKPLQSLRWYLSPLGQPPR